VLDGIGREQPTFEASRELASAVEKRLMLAADRMNAGMELRRQHRNQDAEAMFWLALEAWPRSEQALFLLQATRARARVVDGPAAAFSAAVQAMPTTQEELPATAPRGPIPGMVTQSYPSFPAWFRAAKVDPETTRSSRSEARPALVAVAIPESLGPPAAKRGVPSQDQSATPASPGEAAPSAFAPTATLHGTVSGAGEPASSPTQLASLDLREEILQRAESAFRRGRIDLAVQTLDEALVVAPDEPQLRQQLAWTLGQRALQSYGRGKLVEAILDFQRAAEVCATDPRWAQQCEAVRRELERR
jgi:tetratricopeptide (TPR) repeat protein